MANTEYLPGFVLASSDLSFAYACFPPGACPFETPRMVIHSHCIAVVSGMQFKIVHWGRVKQKISQQPSIVEQFLILLSSEFGIKRMHTDGETIFTCGEADRSSRGRLFLILILIFFDLPQRRPKQPKQTWLHMQFGPQIPNPR